MRNYRSNFVLFTLLLASIVAYGQGGKLKYPSPKNEETKPKPTAASTPRVKKDRTPSGSKVLPSFEFYIGLSAIKPNAEFADEMTSTQYLGNPYWAAPLFTGQMAGGIGMGLDYGFYNPLNGINRRIYTNHFEWGLNWGFEAGFIPHNVERCADYFGSGSYQEDVVQEFTGRYWIFGGKIGPTLTLRPVRDNDLRIDFGFRLKPFFHVLTSMYGYGTDSNSNSISVDVDRQDGEGPFDICTDLEFAIRWPAVKIYVASTKGFADNSVYDESISVNGGSPFVQSFTAKVNLNYIRFGLNLNIVN